jgi:thioredoxin 1
MYRFGIRRLGFILALATIFLGNALAQPAWTTLEKAMELAKKENKWVFLDFYADWCTYCHQLDKTTLRDSQVLTELKKNFLSVKINTESSKTTIWENKTITHIKLAETMGVSSLPMLIFVNKKGELIGHYSSYIDPKLFLSLLKYISSGSREKLKTFEEYISSNK